MFMSDRIASSIAFRHRHGGLFQAPPEVLKKVESFAEKVVCEHHLAEAREKLEALDSISSVKSFLDDMIEALRGFPQLDLMPDRPGEVTRIPFDVTVPIGRRYRIYIRRFEQEYGSDRFHITRQQRAPRTDPPDDELMHSSQVRDRLYDLEEELEDNVRRVGEEIKDFLREHFDPMGPPSPDSIRDRMESIIDACQSRGYTEGRTIWGQLRVREYDVDLSDWTYVQGRDRTLAEEHIEASADEVEQALSNLRQLVEKSEEGSVFIDVPVLTESGGLSTGQVYIATSADGYTFILPATRDAEKQRYEVSSADQAVEVIRPFLRERIRFVEDLMEGRIELSAEEFVGYAHSSFTVQAAPAEGRENLGQYRRSEIQVFWRPEKVKSGNQLEETLDRLERTCRHEVQHYGQDLLDEMFNLSDLGGMPSPSEMTDPVSRPFPGSDEDRQEHPKRDVEFQTRLSDEVKRFRDFVDIWEDKSDRPGFVRDLFRVWVQERDPEGLGESKNEQLALDSAHSKGMSSFQTWKEEGTGKHRRAVNTMYSEVKDLFDDSEDAELPKAARVARRAIDSSLSLIFSRSSRLISSSSSSERSSRSPRLREPSDRRE